MLTPPNARARTRYAAPSAGASPQNVVMYASAPREAGTVVRVIGMAFWTFWMGFLSAERLRVWPFASDRNSRNRSSGS
jgi:hypothetical protein